MKSSIGLALAAVAALAGNPARAEANRGQQEGIASWYGSQHEGRRMANGERFRKEAPTCAHRDLPLGTQIEVQNLRTRQTALCQVTDRGPYKPGRIVDVSEAVARQIGLHDAGLAPARIVVLATR